jgi:hypothetical protein
MSKYKRNRAREREIPLEFNLHRFCEIKLKKAKEKQIEREKW